MEELEYINEEGMWIYKCLLEILLLEGVIDIEIYVGVLLRLDEQWRRKPNYDKLLPWDFVNDPSRDDR